MANIKVKALRGFRGVANGQFREVKVGEAVEVSEFFARELSHSKKAERISDETVKADTEGANKRSKTDAGK